MTSSILRTLHVLRVASRRSTLVGTVALAAGVVMIPLSYRGGVNPWDRWALLGGVLAYVAICGYRIASGLRIERTLESEERQVRLAEREGLSAALKIGRGSGLFQAMEAVRAVDAVDRRQALRMALRRLTGPWAGPRTSPAVAVLIVVGVLWGRIALDTPASRYLPLLVAVLIILVILLACEAWLTAARRTVRGDAARLADLTVRWWALHQAEHSGAPFLHQVYYRDVTDRLGLS